LTGVAAVVAGVFAGAFEVQPAEAGLWPRILKSFSVLLLAGGLLALAGAAQKAGFFGAPPAPRAGIAWQEDLAALDAARRSGRPAVLDFTAETCTVCQEISATTFQDPRIIEESRKFVMVKLDLTGGRNAGAAERFDAKGLPTILFFDRAGRPLSGLSVNRYLDAGEMLKRMRKASGDAAP
jgi:thiol:disulfide interchange protein DsbD